MSIILKISKRRIKAANLSPEEVKVAAKAAKKLRKRLDESSKRLRAA